MVKLRARPREAEVLLQTGWLSRTPADFQQAILDIVLWRDVAAGAHVALAGNETGGLWGVASGQVGLSTSLSSVDSPIADVLLPGAWLGGAPILGYPRGATAVAQVRSLIAELPVAATRALFDSYPGGWRLFADHEYEYVARWGGAMADHVIRHTPSRCIAILLRLAAMRWRDPVPGQVRTITFTQDEFALSTGLSRQAAGDVLRRLDADGLISIGYRTITINDAATLRAMIDHDAV